MSVDENLMSLARWEASRRTEIENQPCTIIEHLLFITYVRTFSRWSSEWKGNLKLVRDTSHARPTFVLNFHIASVVWCQSWHKHSQNSFFEFGSPSPYLIHPSHRFQLILHFFPLDGCSSAFRIFLVPMSFLMRTRTNDSGNRMHLYKWMLLSKCLFFKMETSSLLIFLPLVSSRCWSLCEFSVVRFF